MRDTIDIIWLIWLKVNILTYFRVLSQLLLAVIAHALPCFSDGYVPGVDSVSNINEYQEHFLGVKAAGA